MEGREGYGVAERSRLERLLEDIGIAGRALVPIVVI